MADRPTPEPFAYLYALPSPIKRGWTNETYEAVGKAMREFAAAVVVKERTEIIQLIHDACVGTNDERIGLRIMQAVIKGIAATEAGDG